METADATAAGRGIWGERLAEALLAACGYACLDRRYRTAGGEIDLIVRRGDVLAFVEVKARAATGAASPECFVDRAKRRRLRKAALVWLGSHAGWTGCSLRFDVVSIAHHGPGGGVDIRHLTGVF